MLACVAELLRYLIMQLNVIDVSNGYTSNVINLIIKITIFIKQKNKYFHCINCLADTLPLLSLNNKQFDLTSKGIDYPEDIDIEDIFLSHTQLDMVNKINAAIADGFDIDNDRSDPKSENEIHPIDCKYYTIDKLNEQKFNEIYTHSNSI